jgi:spermidine synthase
MPLPFEQLAWSPTARGEIISLRRRVEPRLNRDVYEVKLGDEFLMSSLFTVAEEELARLGLAAVVGSDLDVVVGGLGLGYTAHAVLADPRVRSLVVVEFLPEVIDWHERGLLPGAEELMADPRTRLATGDFFALADGTQGFGRDVPGRRFDAVLVDIDHSPRHLLHDSHAPFYTVGGLRRLAQHLTTGGVFGLWSDDPPDAAFVADLEEVFAEVEAHVVSFPNLYTGGESANTVYVAVKRARRESNPRPSD